MMERCALGEELSSKDVLSEVPRYLQEVKSDRFSPTDTPPGCQVGKFVLQKQLVVRLENLKWLREI